MYIVSMSGGLGNQMFEYAFYMQLKHLHPNQIVKIDAKYAHPMEHNGIEINRIFGVDIPQAEYEEIIQLTQWFPLRGEKSKKAPWIRRKVNMTLHMPPKAVKWQYDFTTFYNFFFKLKDDVSYYCYGVFANPRYFQSITDSVVSTFTFPEVTEANNLAYRDLIQTSNSVSIHVRRGDYVELGLQTPDKDYYQQAINIILKNVDNPLFFIFSDDIAYVKSWLGNSENIIYVEGNNAELAYRDMQLMSLCKHNIITNSTFSFWGAYLNRNEGKIVIAPNMKMGNSKELIACNEWIII